MIWNLSLSIGEREGKQVIVCDSLVSPFEIERRVAEDVGRDTRDGAAAKATRWLSRFFWLSISES